MKYSVGKDFCLISIINNPESYRDRCAMLAQVGDNSLEHILIVNGFVQCPNEYCTVVYPETPLDNAFKFWLWSFKQVSSFVLNNSSVKFVVHEHSVGAVCFLVKLRLRNNKLLRVCSLYSGEFAFVLKRGWRIDPNGREYLGLKQKFVIIRSRIKPLIYRLFSVWSAEVVVGNSEESAGELHNIFRGRQRNILNTCVIPNTVNAEAGVNLRPLPFQRDRFRLLYAGKIYPAKGIGTLLSAFSELLNSYKDRAYSLTLIGRLSNNDQSWFNSILIGLGLEGKVTLIPSVPKAELLKYYTDSDLLVLPSFFEGSPRVMKEAMAAGLPVICSRIPGTKVVDPEGSAAMFFEPGDSPQLASKIVEISRDNKQLRSRRSKGLALASQFSPDLIARERTQFAKDLLAKRFTLDV